MFVLSTVKVRRRFAQKRCSDERSQDTVALQPATFGIPPDQAIISELNKKYANRILHDVGLCICVFDLSQAGEGKVRYGDGCLWHKGAMFQWVF